MLGSSSATAGVVEDGAEAAEAEDGTAGDFPQPMKHPAEITIASANQAHVRFMTTECLKSTRFSTSQ
jgi:hypothetical protein